MTLPVESPEFEEHRVGFERAWPLQGVPGLARVVQLPGVDTMGSF